MPVTCKADPKDKTLTISISGQFDFSAHPQFRASYKEIDNSYAVIVDLRETENMDSAALGMLLLLDENFSDKKVKLINANDFVRQVLEIAHFSEKFDID
jgi:HptB-dependent secretion and biofilm anti anti-sigma factor